MSGSEIKFIAGGKQDRYDNEYYWVRPELPVLVDLSEVVMFFRPDEDENGKFFLEVSIKKYTGKCKKPAPTPLPAATKE